MKIKEYVEFLNLVEKLKCNTRHSWTSSGRHESVAEHSWRITLMAMLIEDEFPEIDITKLMKMCVIHDFGEALTGDIPAFLKTSEDEKLEDDAVETILSKLPENYKNEFTHLFTEMNKRESLEAKLLKALDNMEAIVSHNEADISSWLPNEYHDNLTYGADKVTFSAWTQSLKDYLNQESIKKINESKL